LSYFQFNGESYRLRATATLTSDANGNAKIVPDQNQN